MVELHIILSSMLTATISIFNLWAAVAFFCAYPVVLLGFKKLFNKDKINN